MTPTLVIPETIVLPGERLANVRIQLAKPARRPLHYRVETQNGSKLATPLPYVPTSKSIIFQPGETEKSVTVSLRGDLGEGTVRVVVGWSTNHPPVQGTSGIIRKGQTRRATAALPQTKFRPAQKQQGRKLVFNSRFMEPISPEAVRGAWRSRPHWGRVQTGNGEIAPYADAKTDPGTQPHPVVNGQRVLRAEHVPVKDGQKNYSFSASMLTSMNLFNFRYGYVELRAKVSRVQGTIPAFWLVPSDGSWPPEMDVFEYNYGDKGQMSSFIHFRNVAGNKLDEGFMVPDWNPDDGQFHTYGFEWTPEWQISLFDGREVARRPNIFHVPMQIILNIAVGGLAPAPDAPKPGWKSEMTLDYLKVWQ